jgi:hypothetical protein
MDERGVPDAFVSRDLTSPDQDVRVGSLVTEFLAIGGDPARAPRWLKRFNALPTADRLVMTWTLALTVGTKVGPRLTLPPGGRRV